MKNFKIYEKTGEATIIKADSARFRKQAIIFESHNLMECYKYIVSMGGNEVDRYYYDENDNSWQFLAWITNLKRITANQ